MNTQPRFGTTLEVTDLDGSKRHFTVLDRWVQGRYIAARSPRGGTAIIDMRDRDIALAPVDAHSAVALAREVSRSDG